MGNKWKGKDDGAVTDRVEPESFYRGLDPGIRFAVRVLHAVGIETCQSCEGGKGHCYEGPTVDLHAGSYRDTTGFSAVDALAVYGLEPVSLALFWHLDPLGYPFERLWRIVLRRAAPERADETPTFRMVWKAQGPK